jgi:hypothetical protein
LIDGNQQRKRWALIKKQPFTDEVFGLLPEAWFDVKVVHEEGINVSRSVERFTSVAGSVAGLSVNPD